MVFAHTFRFRVGHDRTAKVSISFDGVGALGQDAVKCNFGVRQFEVPRGSLVSPHKKKLTSWGFIEVKRTRSPAVAMRGSQAGPEGRRISHVVSTRVCVPCLCTRSRPGGGFYLHKLDIGISFHLLQPWGAISMEMEMFQDGK